MKKTLKKILFLLAPKKMAVVQSIRARRNSHRVVSEWGLNEYSSVLLSVFKNEIQSGPFKGMKLVSDCIREHLCPFLIGTYESEVHDWIYEIQQYSFPQIIDIGSKFGYYAVGFSRMFPAADVIAFDIDPWARKVTNKNASLNKVDNLRVLKWCDRNWLNKNIISGSLIICDVDGYENELFDEPLSGALSKSTIILETHDCIVKGSRQKIIENLSSTHFLREVNSEVSKPLPFDLRKYGFKKEDEEKLVCEFRPSQTWLLAKPKDNFDSSSLR